MRFVIASLVVALAACRSGSSDGPTGGSAGGGSSSGASSSSGSSSGGAAAQCASVAYQTSIRTIAVGVDDDGRAAVLLDSVRAGECEAAQGELLHPSTLVLRAPFDTVLVPGKRTLNEAAVTKTGPSSYAWTDLGLSLRGAVFEPSPSLHLTVTAGDREETVVCEPEVRGPSCDGLE